MSRDVKENTSKELIRWMTRLVVLNGKGSNPLQRWLSAKLSCATGLSDGPLVPEKKASRNDNHESEVIRTPSGVRMLAVSSKKKPPCSPGQ